MNFKLVVQRSKYLIRLWIYKLVSDSVTDSQCVYTVPVFNFYCTLFEKNLTELVIAERIACIFIT